MPAVERWGRWCLLVSSLAGCATSPPATLAAPQPQEPAPRPQPAPRHQAGTNFVTARVHHGVPILQRSFFWDGNGEVEDSGLGLHVGRHIDEHVALGLGANLVSWWTPGANVHSAELEGLVRIHPVAHWPFFLDGTGGYQLADDQIPPGGTVWNFSFGFGGGMELPIDEDTDVLIGVTYHHISNALGRDNDRNPSQNEARFWVGIGWSF